MGGEGGGKRFQKVKRGTPKFFLMQVRIGDFYFIPMTETSIVPAFSACIFATAMEYKLFFPFSLFFFLVCLCSRMHGPGGEPGRVIVE